MSRLVCCVLALVSGLGLAACGNPEIKVPDPLEVVYMPLAGAVEVEPGVEIKVFFSGAVDAASVTAASVYLESADLTAGACGEAWSEVSLSPSVPADEPEVVQLGPGTDLDAATCYRLTCTTAVRGVELAPLPDLARPDRPGVGAEAVFITRSN